MGKSKTKLLIIVIAAFAFGVGLVYFLITGGSNKDYRVSWIVPSSQQIRIYDKANVFGEDAKKLSGMLERCARNGEDIVVITGYSPEDFTQTAGIPSVKKDTYYVELHIGEGFTRVYKRNASIEKDIEQWAEIGFLVYKGDAWYGYDWFSYRDMDHKAEKLMEEQDYVGSTKQLLKEILRNQKEQEGVLSAVQECSVLLIVLVSGILILYVVVRRGREDGVKTRTDVDDVAASVRFFNTTTARTGTKETPKYNDDYEGDRYSRSHSGSILFDLFFGSKRK